MALVSPRFAANVRLQQAALNAPTMKKGERGNAVHLVQFAFLELGYKMPISTAKPQISPDGIFGAETEAVVRQFQQDRKRIDPTIGVDGIVGKQTMGELDRLLPGYTKRVPLHFRSIAMQNVHFEISFASAQQVYDQYGIKVEFASGESLLLTPAQEAMFQKIDQECNWDITAGEYFELHQLGTPAPPNEIVVYYVKELLNAGGCGGHAPLRPAATVAANTTQWATAHEVGHVLLTKHFNPLHFTDSGNLMWDQVLHFTSTPILSDKQVAQMRNSPCCTPI
jgi:hypothetical protein